MVVVDCEVVTVPCIPVVWGCPCLAVSHPTLEEKACLDTAWSPAARCQHCVGDTSIHELRGCLKLVFPLKKWDYPLYILESKGMTS